MKKTVQILGMAANLAETPDVPGAERWCAGKPRSYKVKWKPALETYTRWFNMHTLRHIETVYPSAIFWLRDQGKPVYLQEPHPSIPTSRRFPREDIQAFFSQDGTPFRYFTCSATWFIALAIYEGFERIELWGFELKRDRQYDFERPCFFWWVEEARRRGIEVIIPPGVEITPGGDPASYTGPLYGFEPHNDIYRRTF